MSGVVETDAMSKESLFGASAQLLLARGVKVGAGAAAGVGVGARNKVGIGVEIGVGASVGAGVGASVGVAVGVGVRSGAVSAGVGDASSHAANATLMTANANATRSVVMAPPLGWGLG